MDEVLQGFLKQGVLGLVIIALGFAVVYLFKKYSEIQEKRIAESRESIKAIEQNTNTLDTMTEVLRERSRP
jgi:hypothetical protein